MQIDEEINHLQLFVYLCYDESQIDFRSSQIVNILKSKSENPNKTGGPREKFDSCRGYFLFSSLP